MKVKYFDITHEALASLLGLPSDTVFIHAETNRQGNMGFMAHSNEFDDVVEGRYPFYEPLPAVIN